MYKNEEQNQENNAASSNFYLDELILQDRSFIRRMIEAKKDRETLKIGVEKSITPEIIVQEEVVVSHHESAKSLATNNKW